MTRAFVSEAQYKLEFQAMVDLLYSHPSIVYWVPFNEGWGQFKTMEITQWVQALDTTRIVGGPSGGNHFDAGDTRDHHQYPGPAMPAEVEGKALVLGEFGGLGLPIEGHLWQENMNWGYRELDNKKALGKAYLSLIEQLKPLVKKGLAAAIYTQTTDVEGEVNGIMTYDRAVVKLPEKKVKKAHEALLQLQ
jgi:hypothetical protein